MEDSIELSNLRARRYGLILQLLKMNVEMKYIWQALSEFKMNITKIIIKIES